MEIVIKDYAHALELREAVDIFDDLAEQHLLSSAEHFKKCLVGGIKDINYCMAVEIEKALDKWYDEHRYCVSDCNKHTIERFATREEADNYCLNAKEGLPMMVYFDDDDF